MNSQSASTCCASVWSHMSELCTWSSIVPPPRYLWTPSVPPSIPPLLDSDPGYLSPVLLKLTASQVAQW